MRWFREVVRLQEDVTIFCRMWTLPHKNGCQKYLITPIFIHTVLLVYGKQQQQQQQRIM